MLNEALKQIRIFHNLKQNEMCEKLGISKSYLSEIESGKKAVSIPLLERYADYFSVPISSLMMFSEKIDAGKRSYEIRLKCADKILRIMDWMNEGKKRRKTRKKAKD